MLKDTITTFVRSKFFVGVIAGVGSMLAAIIIFEVGVFVGFHEAQFSARWGANYEHNFGGPGMGISGFDAQLPDAHGAFGQVLNVGSSTLTISNNHKQEQKVLIDSNTIIRDHENTITAAQISSGEYVIVLGEPSDNGEVTAKLIRIMPAPGTTTMPGVPAP